MLGHYLLASETPFKWNFDPLSRAHQKKKKKKTFSELDPLWQNFLDPCMNCNHGSALLLYLFALMLYVQVNNFSVMYGCVPVFLGWTWALSKRWLAILRSLCLLVTTFANNFGPRNSFNPAQVPQNCWTWSGSKTVWHWKQMPERCFWKV